MASEGETYVRVAEESYLARWADWQARGRGRPLAAIGAEGARPTLFVADEVLVDGRDRNLVEELIGRHGAVLLPASPPPPAPAGLARRGGVDVAAMPLPVRLRFPEAPRVERAAERLEELARRGRELSGEVTVTSEPAARLAALVARYAAEERPIGLDVVGRTEALPLTAVREWNGVDPFQWGAFAGTARIAQAWQLVDSYRQLLGGAGRAVFIGILDSGFWLDAAGRPVVPAGQPESDLGAAAPQLNLLDETGARAGGASGIKCGDDYNCPWHGNGVASAAAGTVGNLAGAAGAGGTVAWPVPFKTDGSCSQFLRCLQVCLAWGLDVLNMSLSFSTWELVFPTGSWNDAFQFATDHGLVMIAAAGNDDEELPDHNIRPATRTPGVITVAALETDENGGYTRKASFSNYGSSVSIWAPGTGVPVAPDPNHADIHTIAGTSVAAPLVAGVAAMMRSIDDSLGTVRIREILAETGWRGTGHVGVGLDAQAAVFAVLRRRLPDTGEPNDSAAAAAELRPLGPGGTLVPSFGGFTARSHASDEDWWKFRTDSFVQATITAEWYQRLSTFRLEVHADDAASRAPDEMTHTWSAADATSVHAGLLPPGTYRLRVTGSGATAYRLQVRLQPARLDPDLFEENDSFERAARLLFEPRKGALARLEWGPGVFDATLHTTPDFLSGGRRVNPDYFRFEVPGDVDLRIPTVSLYRTDAPVDVTLFDEARNPIESWLQTRNVKILPPPGTTCYLRVTGAVATRYTLSVRRLVDPHNVPEPLQEELQVLPPWWGDPVLRIEERFGHFLVERGNDPVDGDRIVFQPTAEPLALELLDPAGQVIGQGQEQADGRLAVDTRGLEPGAYVLRVARAEMPADDPASQTARLPALDLRLAPPR